MTTRTPQDYALEHAEYMARAGERLIEAVNADAALRIRIAESDDVSVDDEHDVQATVDERLRAMRNSIYEFRKRRDRALSTAEAAAAQPSPVAAEPTGWQPMETAPKDGRTLLLGYFNSHGKWRTLRGRWMSEDYIAEYWEEPEGVEPGWFETSVEADEPPNCWRTDPSHWQPLPTAPKEIQSDQ